MGEKIKEFMKKFKENLFNKENFFTYKILLILNLFLGFYIPLQVISTNVQEFCVNGHSILRSVIICAITYLIICHIIYAIYVMLNSKVKLVLKVIFVICLFCSFLSFFLFGDDFRSLTSNFTFDGNVGIYDIDINSNLKRVINISLYILIIFVAIIFVKLQKYTKHILNILIIVVLISSSINFVKDAKSINWSFKDYLTSKNKIKVEDLKPIYNFSKNKKNVLFIFIDRYPGIFLERVLALNPEYKEKLEGFRFYPNTLSFGAQTTSGTPGLFGGYRNIPAESDKRDENIVKKHNEAITTMPKLFSNNNMNTTINWAPDTNYWIASMSNPFKEIPNVKVENYTGQIYDEFFDKNIVLEIKSQLLNMIQYSVMVSVPYFLKYFVYNDGDFYIPKSYISYRSSFFNSYLSFKTLKNQTNFVDTDTDQLFILSYEFCHEAQTLSYPEYEVTSDKKKLATDENTGANDESRLKNTENVINPDFHVGMGLYSSCVFAIKELCNFIDYLKANGSYDNTRIIVASDHGFYGTMTGKKINTLRDNDAKYHQNRETMIFAPLYYNPALLVKDFDDNSEFTYDSKFMTNADVVTLASKDLIENPLDPYSGEPINSDYKNNDFLYVVGELQPWQPTVHVNENRHESMDRHYFMLEGKNMWDLEKWSAIFGFNPNICFKHENLEFHKANPEIPCGEYVIKDYYYCNRCKNYLEDRDGKFAIVNRSDVIGFKPHLFTNYVTNNDETDLNHGTCTAICDLCNVATDTKYNAEAKGYHVSTYSEIFKTATIDADGHHIRTCDFCGKELYNVDTIKKIDRVELEYESVTCDDKKHTPEVKVYDSDNNIIKKEYYILRYHDNLHPGIATVNLEFRDLYEGSIAKPFTINYNDLIIDRCDINGKDITIQYKKTNDKISGFEIEYSDKEDFDPLNTIVTDVKKKGSNTITFKSKLSSKKKHYLRVRQYRNIELDDGKKIKFYGNWTEIFEAKEKK